jgi:hypothetical protein
LAPDDLIVGEREAILELIEAARESSPQQRKIKK